MSSDDGATAVGTNAVLENKWWEKNNIAATKIDIRADPTVKRTKSGRTIEVKQKYRRGCLMMTGAVLLRILGIVAGAGTIFVGGWMIYKTATELIGAQGTSKVAQYGAMAIFLILAGLLFIIVECRTKRAMRGCLNTYIIVANYLTRGVYLMGIGGLMFTSVVYKFPLKPPAVQFWWFATLNLVLGALNCLYYIAYFRHQRNKAVAMQTKYIANAEEIAYGMNLYDPEQRKLEEEKEAARQAALLAAPSSGSSSATARQSTDYSYALPPIPIAHVAELDDMSGKGKGKEPAYDEIDLKDHRTSKSLPAVPVGVPAV